DDERAIQPESNLRRGPDVGMIPKRPRIWHHEVVAEGLPRQDLRLRHTGNSVHIVGDAQAVPMDAGRLRELVLEVNDDSVALGGADRWPGNAAVVGVDFAPDTRKDLHLRDARHEVRLEDMRIVGLVRGPAHPDPGVPIWRLDRRLAP